MLLDEKINDLQNLTQQKISYQQVADVLGLGSKQAAYNRVTRKQPLKEWEIIALDNAFLNQKVNKTNQEDCIIVDHIHINPSCGKGTSVYYDSDITPIKLGTQLLQSVLKVSHPQNLKVFVANGDSMTPVIENGDMLLIDTGRTDFSNGGIFLLTINNDWFIKRLRKRITGELDIISDNTSYPVETFKPDMDIEIFIKGRVIKNLSRGL